MLNNFANKIKERSGELTNGLANMAEMFRAVKIEDIPTYNNILEVRKRIINSDQFKKIHTILNTIREREDIKDDIAKIFPSPSAKEGEVAHFLNIATNTFIQFERLFNATVQDEATEKTSVAEALLGAMQPLEDLIATFPTDLIVPAIEFFVSNMKLINQLRHKKLDPWINALSYAKFFFEKNLDERIYREFFEQNAFKNEAGREWIQELGKSFRLANRLIAEMKQKKSEKEQSKQRKEQTKERALSWSDVRREVSVAHGMMIILGELSDSVDKLSVMEGFQLLVSDVDKQPEIEGFQLIKSMFDEKKKSFSEKLDVVGHKIGNLYHDIKKVFNESETAFQGKDKVSTREIILFVVGNLHPILKMLADLASAYNKKKSFDILQELNLIARDVFLFADEIEIAFFLKEGLIRKNLLDFDAIKKTQQLLREAGCSFGPDECHPYLEAILKQRSDLLDENRRKGNVISIGVIQERMTTVRRIFIGDEIKKRGVVLDRVARLGQFKAEHVESQGCQELINAFYNAGIKVLRSGVSIKQQNEELHKLAYQYFDQPHLPKKILADALMMIGALFAGAGLLVGCYRKYQGNTFFFSTSTSDETKKVKELFNEIPVSVKAVT